MTRFVTALWIAAAALLAVGVYFSREAESLAGTLQGMRNQRASAEPTSRVADPATIRAQTSITSAGAAGPPAGDSLRVKAAPALEEGRRGTVQFSSNAPSPEANASEAGIRVRTRYHAMYRQLELGPEQIARFEESMRNKSFATDVFTVNLGMTPEHEQQYLDSKMLVIDEVVRDTLGESKVSAVRHYIATADLQEVADKLAVSTFASGSPLTSTQADRLVQTCLALRSDTDQAVTRVDPRTVDWPAVLDQAVTFLTPSQLVALRAMVDQRNFDQAYSDVTGGGRRPPVRNF